MDTETNKESEILKPSRELDARVAIEVMGWTDIEWVTPVYTGISHPQGKDHEGRKRVIPEYSRKIEEAWKVVEKLVKDGHSFDISSTEFSIAGSPTKRGWHSFFTKSDNYELAESAPLAICLTAMKTATSTT